MANEGAGTNNSVGKISLELEVTSDLNKQIGDVANKLGKQLSESFTNSTKGLFDGLSESIDSSMKAINDTIKISLDEMKTNTEAAIQSINEASKNIKVPDTKTATSNNTSNTSLPQPGNQPTNSSNTVPSIKIPDLSAQTSSAANVLSKKINSTFSKIFSIFKSIKMPSINSTFSNKANAQIPTNNTATATPTRGPPVNNGNMEAIKAQIDNLTQKLDIVNTKIEQQRNKLAGLKESYTSTFNEATKNKLQEQMLNTELVINRLIGQSDKLGFTLSDLDGKYNALAEAEKNAGNEATEAMNKNTNAVNEKGNALDKASRKINKFGREKTIMEEGARATNKNTNAVKAKGNALNGAAGKLGFFTSKVKGALSALKGAINPLKGIGSATSNSNKHMNNMHRGLSNIAKQFFTWMIVLPLIMKGLSAMATGMMNNLNTSSKFVASLNQVKTNLMVAFTPIYQAILPAINSLMSALATATAYIASFISALFGKTYQQSYKATQSLIDAKKAMGAYGDSAKKTASELKGLAAFDEINNLNKDSSGADESKVPTLTQPNMDMDSIDNQMNSMIDNVKQRMQEIFDTFKDGFKIGFGDTNFDGIKQAVNGIKESLKGIFTDSDVANSAKNFSDAFITNLGKVTGAAASIGVTVAENLLGGLDKYLDKNSDYIKKSFTSIFNIGSDIANITGDFATVLADIFSVFRSDTAKQITADIIEIFSNAFLGILELGLKLGRDILDTITRPIIENKDAIKNALENTLAPMKTVLDSIAKFVTDTFLKINQMYDEHIKPLFTAIGDGLSKMLSTVLDGYNTYIAPVLQNLADKFSELMDNHIQPLMDKFIELFGTIVDGIAEIWTNTLVPFIDWFIANIFPVIAPILEGIGTGFMTMLGVIADTIGNVIDVLKGIVDFIVGVFTGDWDKAWTGVKEIFKGVFDSFVGIAKAPINAVIGLINGLISAINIAIKGLNKIDIDIPDWVPGIGGESFGLNIPTIGKIPYLAKGGIVDSPTLAMVGEAGKEAVVPLENNTGWITQLASQVAAMIGTNSNSVNTEQQGGDIIFMIDGSVIGKVAIKQLRKMQRQGNITVIPT